MPPAQTASRECRPGSSRRSACKRSTSAPRQPGTKHPGSSIGQHQSSQPNAGPRASSRGACGGVGRTLTSRRIVTSLYSTATKTSHVRANNASPSDQSVFIRVNKRIASARAHPIRRCRVQAPRRRGQERRLVRWRDPAWQRRCNGPCPALHEEQKHGLSTANGFRQQAENDNGAGTIGNASRSRRGDTGAVMHDRRPQDILARSSRSPCRQQTPSSANPCSS